MSVLRLAEAVISPFYLLAGLPARKLLLSTDLKVKELKSRWNGNEDLWGGEILEDCHEIVKYKLPILDWISLVLAFLTGPRSNVLRMLFPTMLPSAFGLYL